MFIEFTQKDGTEIILNTRHIVSIEKPMVLAGIQGGIAQIRLHCLEGRVFSVDPKIIPLSQIRKQLEIKELDGNVRQDQDSPIKQG